MRIDMDEMSRCRSCTALYDLVKAKFKTRQENIHDHSNSYFRCDSSKAAQSVMRSRFEIGCVCLADSGVSPTHNSTTSIIRQVKKRSNVQYYFPLLDHSTCSHVAVTYKDSSQPTALIPNGP